MKTNNSRNVKILILILQTRCRNELRISGKVWTTFREFIKYNGNETYGEILNLHKTIFLLIHLWLLHYTCAYKSVFIYKTISILKFLHRFHEPPVLQRLLFYFIIPNPMLFWEAFAFTIDVFIHSFNGTS